jgi:putative membrane protein
MAYALARWLVIALSILLASRFVPGIEVESVYTALVVAVALGLVNLILRPIVLLFTLPLTIMTLGLFTFVVNAVMFWFVSSFIKGFEVEGFVPALLGSLVVSIVSFLGNRFLAAIDKDENDE